MKRVIDTKAAKSISAYIILFKDQYGNTDYHGKIQVHYAPSKTIVDVWFEGLDCGQESTNNSLLPTYTKFVAQGSASGYGYDKEAAALSQAFRKFKNLTQWFDGQIIHDLDSMGVRALEKSSNLKVIGEIQVIQAI